MWVSECDKYIKIFKFFYTNIYSDLCSYKFIGYKYIQILIHVKFLDMNIFGSSFVSRFSGHKYILKMLFMVINFSGVFTEES